MYRGSMRSVGRLSYRLRHRRVGVDGLDQLFDGHFHAQRHHRFRHQLSRARADDVDAENLVVLLLGDD